MSEARFTDVWEALEATPELASTMRARSEFMAAIRDAVDDWKTTKADAAERLGLTREQFDDLSRGRVDEFSIDALIRIARSAGLAVEWRIAPAA